MSKELINPESKCMAKVISMTPVPQTHDSSKAFPGQGPADVDYFLLLDNRSLRLLSYRALLPRLASPTCLFSCIQ